MIYFSKHVESFIAQAKELSDELRRENDFLRGEVKRERERAEQAINQMVEMAKARPILPQSDFGQHDKTLTPRIIDAQLKVVSMVGNEFDFAGIDGKEAN